MAALIFDVPTRGNRKFLVVDDSHLTSTVVRSPWLATTPPLTEGLDG